MEAIKVKLHHAPNNVTIFSVDGVFFCYTFFKLTFIYSMSLGLHIQDKEYLLANEPALQKQCLRFFFKNKMPLVQTKHKNLEEFVETITF